MIKKYINIVKLFFYNIYNNNKKKINKMARKKFYKKK